MFRLTNCFKGTGLKHYGCELFSAILQINIPVPVKPQWVYLKVSLEKKIKYFFIEILVCCDGNKWNTQKRRKFIIEKNIKKEC